MTSARAYFQVRENFFRRGISPAASRRRAVRSDRPSSAAASDNVDRRSWPISALSPFLNWAFEYDEEVAAAVKP